MLVRPPGAEGRGPRGEMRGVALKSYSSWTAARIVTIFGLKHLWGKTVIFYINEVGATPGAGGAGPNRGNKGIFASKSYSCWTTSRIVTIFGLKHLWDKMIIFYINEVGATPGPGGAGPQRGNFCFKILLLPLGYTDFNQIWQKWCLGQCDHILYKWSGPDPRAGRGGALKGEFLLSNSTPRKRLYRF